MIYTKQKFKLILTFGGMLQLVVVLMLYMQPLEKISFYNIPVLIFLITIAFLYNLIINKNIIYSYDLIWLFSCIYLFFNICITGFSYSSIKFSIYYFLDFFLIILMVRLDCNIQSLIKITYYLSILFAVFTIIQYIFPSSFIHLLKLLYNDQLVSIFEFNQLNGRFGGLCGYPGANACLISFGCIISFSEMKKDDIIKLINMLLMIIAICITGSRSIFITTFIALFISYILTNTYTKGIVKKHKMKIRKALKFILISSIILILLFIIVPNLSISLSRLRNISNKDSSLVARDQLRATAYQLYRNNKLFGIGINKFYDYTIQINNTQKTFAHNVYLQLMAETGIIGIIVILYPFLYSLIKTWKIAVKEKYDIKDSKLIMISIYIQLVFFIYSFSGNPFYDEFIRTYCFLYFYYPIYKFKLASDKLYFRELNYDNH